MSNEQVVSSDNHVESEIPQNERQSWLSVMFVWMGCMICVPSILIGQSLVTGMNFMMALVAGLIGYVIVLVVAILQGMQSADLGRPTVVVAKPAYGEVGSKYIFSFVIAIALIGWFGIQTSIAGSSLQGMLAVFNIIISKNVAMIVSGILMLTCAIYGFKMMEKLNFVSVPLLVIVLFWAMINALTTTDLSLISSYTPTEELSMLSGISVVIGGFIVGAVIAGDFTRFNKDRKDTIKSAAVGIVPAGLFLVVVGAFLTISANTPNANLEEVLVSQIPIPFIAFLTLFLATWTTNVSNAYSAGIALVNGFNLDGKDRALVTAISGVIGTLLAVFGILDSIVLFLLVLTNLVTPIAGVMIADYWIINKGNPEGYMERKPHPVFGVVAWLVGALPSLIVTIMSQFDASFIANNQLLADTSNFIGIFVSLALYLALIKFSKHDAVQEVVYE